MFSDALYSVENDPGEEHNLIDDPDHQQVASQLASKIDQFFERHAARHADLWQGGRPIQNSVRAGFWAESWGDDWRPVYRYEDDG